MMAKIVIVLNASWNVWNFRLPLLRSLQQDGHQVEVIAPRDAYTDRIPYPCHHIEIKSSSTNPVTDLKILFDLVKLFRETQADIALLYTAKPNIYGNLAARLTGVRTISNIAGLGSVFNSAGPLVTLVKWLYLISLSGADTVFFQNNEDRGQFIARKLVKPHKTAVLPGSGVDLERFSPREVQREDVSPDCVFLMPSRMLWDKGVGEYVYAGKRLLSEGYSVEFRLVGCLDADNPSAISPDEVQHLTDTFGIDYRGVSDCIEEEIAQADCVVLPSYYREGTPRALLEAAAMAKPVITTDAPGCRDVVDDGITGYLCKPRDAFELYKKLKKVADLGKAERQSMGSRGREKMVGEYDQKTIFDCYLSAVNRIIKA